MLLNDSQLISNIIKISFNNYAQVSNNFVRLIGNVLPFGTSMNNSHAMAIEEYETV
jgi:hypothetical protein